MKKLSLLFAFFLLLSACSTPIETLPDAETADQDLNNQAQEAEENDTALEDESLPNAETEDHDLNNHVQEAKENDTALEDETLPEGTFELNEYGNFFGELYVKGALVQKNIPESFCEEPCETNFEAIFLKVTETGNKPFEEFLKENSGNAYARPSREGALAEIMIGCREDSSIWYSNDSDEQGFASREISGEHAQAFFRALDTGAELRFKLTKLSLSGGRGAPACYSHFYDIEIL